MTNLHFSLTKIGESILVLSALPIQRNMTNFTMTSHNIFKLQLENERIENKQFIDDLQECKINI